jgi:alkylhydroperoxidase family enzyme
MARISLDPPRTLSYRIASRFSRRRYGTVLDPVAAVAHNARVGLAYGLFELQVERWRTLDQGLKDLAVMMAAATIGCSWCMDFGYWESLRQGVDGRKVRDLPRWRESTLYTAQERAVLAYAEAATVTPPEVTEEVTLALREHFDDAQIVELAMLVALENLRSRFNTGVGLTSQGFKEECELQPVAV